MGRSWPNEVRDPLNGLYQTKNLKWSKSHCCLKKVLYSPRSSTSSPGPPKWKVDLIELLGQSECLHLGKESYAKSWFRVYKVCIIGRAKRSQQHPVFQGGQPAKYLMTGLNIVYLQWSDENWCQCDMAVASETLNFWKKKNCNLNFKSKSLASYYRK